VIAEAQQEAELRSHKAPLAQHMLSSVDELREHETTVVDKSPCISIARRGAHLTRSAPGTKHEVLIIDDDAYFAVLVEKLLSFAGYAVRTATNRLALSRELRKETLPHLIILDVELGKLSGFDVLTRLRRHERFSFLPVIMLSAHVTRKDVSRGLLAGADGYVSKPCRFFALNHAIRTVLDIH